ncbi:MAG TPA: teichoic acid ABC transporter permease [Spirochaetia bacterium]|nr:teichoic acid ABC transporter permease [Spirochaetia bacterium]
MIYYITPIIFIFFVIIFILRKKIVKNIKDFFYFLLSIYETRYTIYQLTTKDLTKRYLGSFLGVVWAFIQPLVYILVMWFVFSFGFRSGQTVNEYPFILWLISAMIPWFFISEILVQGSRSILDYSYLIKKIVFRSSIIPVVKILTGLIIHLFFLVIIILFFFIHGYFPILKWIQVLYYLLCSLVFLLGFSWLTSSVTVFIKDVPQFVNVINQILFWFTPIFWPIEKVQSTTTLGIIIRLNPFLYIIQGYRESFLGTYWFWQHPLQTLYFWIITIFLFISGALIFRKLKPHFPDVL